MNTEFNDLYDVTQDEIVGDSDDVKLSKHSLLYPVAKAFLEQYPQYHDIISTYEQSMEELADVVGIDSVLDEYLQLDEGSFVNFKMSVQNLRIYSPDSREAAAFSNTSNIPTPNAALAAKDIYAATIVGDIVYSFVVSSCGDRTKNFMDVIRLINKDKSVANVMMKVDDVITNGYIVSMPIPIGCKWCSLTHYDPATLIKTAEEMKTFYGFFIVDGFFRYILPVYKKPFNKTVICKNQYDDQISRVDVLYSKGYEYEDSFYVIGAIVAHKGVHIGRVGGQASPPDFGFSLQLNHPSMYQETSLTGKHSHKLFNYVPIKFLFAAFGCVTDKDLIKYICPQMNDFGLINAIRNAVLNGHKHREAVQNASFMVNAKSEHLSFESTLTENDAKYIIGCNILSVKTKEELLLKANNDELKYKIFVVCTVTDILNNCFMPGVGEVHTDKDTVLKIDRNTAVCVELGSIVRQLYLIGYGLLPSQDKTSLMNRRVRNGQQMTREFKTFHNVRLREAWRELKQAFEMVTSKNISGIGDTIRNIMITRAKVMSKDQCRSLVNAFKGTSKEQSKIHTELLTAKNQAFVWNRLREIVISSDTKAVGATVSWDHRTVHPSELFFICPTQTPEAGSQTGRYKTPSLFTYITLSTKGYNVPKIMSRSKYFIKDINDVGYSEHLYALRINGSVFGYAERHTPIETIYADLMRARRGIDEISIECDATVSLNHHTRVLDVWTDTGRIVGAFINVNNSFDITYAPPKEYKVDSSVLGVPIPTTCAVKPEFTKWLNKCMREAGHFNEGIKNGFIEMLCPDMTINNALIAPSTKVFYEKPYMYTHIALPCHINGVIAGIVSAVNLNVAVRSAYLTNHVKQAIGPSLRYPQLKYMGDHNVQIAPQVPLVRPCVYDYLHMHETPIGQNVIVAFMQYKYNQEDAIILNRDAVEKGLLKIDSLITYDHRIDKNDEEFRLPGPGVRFNGNPASYSKLNPSTALPAKIGDTFYQKDVVIGKVSKSASGESDTSICNDRPDGKYPASANPRPLRCIGRNDVHDENKIMKKAIFGQYRVPIVGDKFNSEHAQKGTCGHIMDPVKMPYSSTGIRPDIIFNPPSIFKRKTYGQIYLPILAKISALLGCPIDCTPHHTVRNEDDFYKLLYKLGLSDAGYETMYDADTGRPYKSRIFFANHYWERQSHLVEQKLNVRNGGDRVAETGQPVKGRKHTGGQAADKMSFDSHNAAGICEIVRDLHLNQGSKINVGICKICSQMSGYYHRQRGEWVCSRCGAHSDMIIQSLPPGSVLMHHLLTGLHVAVDYVDDIRGQSEYHEYIESESNKTIPPSGEYVEGELVREPLANFVEDEPYADAIM